LQIIRIPGFSRRVAQAADPDDFAAVQKGAPPHCCR